MGMNWGYIFSKITYLFYLLEYDQLPYRFLTCLFSYVGTFLFLDFPQPGIFVDTRLALQPQNLYKRKMKESLAFTYFSLHLHLSPDKTLQRHTYFICTTMFSFHVFLMSISTKSFKKHVKRKLSFYFSSCLKKGLGAFYTDLRIWWMMGCNKLAIFRVDIFVYLSSRPLLLSQIIILKLFRVMKTEWKVTSQTYFSKLMRAVHSLKVLV